MNEIVGWDRSFVIYLYTIHHMFHVWNIFTSIYHINLCHSCKQLFQLYMDHLRFSFVKSPYFFAPRMSHPLRHHNHLHGRCQGGKGGKGGAMASRLDMFVPYHFRHEIYVCVVEFKVRSFCRR